MIKIWFRAIQKGLKTISDVPERIRADVQALLDIKEVEE